MTGPGSGFIWHLSTAFRMLLGLSESQLFFIKSRAFLRDGWRRFSAGVNPSLLFSSSIHVAHRSYSSSLNGFPTATSISWNRYIVEAGITAKSILCLRSSTLTESYKSQGKKLKRFYDWLDRHGASASCMSSRENLEGRSSNDSMTGWTES